jgi:hypothetical protein
MKSAGTPIRYIVNSDLKLQAPADTCCQLVGRREQGGVKWYLFCLPFLAELQSID